ncbi:MAG: tRNA 2-thiouridine(34) synthase MnmA [Pseudomonadota bacterium]
MTNPTPNPDFSSQEDRANPDARAHDVAGPRKRVVVAMSGGVDSSVVAALMKEAGHEVIGMTMQLYDHGSAVGKKGACCAGQDIHDAQAVADLIGIPHYVLDYEQRFKSSVIDAFADSYIAGETPIPCVLCNSHVKFADLLNTAMELGADALATGHYIARRDGAGGPELLRAQDADRDQSYFLFTTTPTQLDKLWFPLGDMPKARVRELAERYKLPVASKSDSQDICFVPSGKYGDVIAKLRPDAMTAGDIVHVDGRVLGRHDGIVHYTIGQRRGLGVADGAPLYVVKLDRYAHRVIVGPRECLETSTILLRDINWLGDGAFSDLPVEGVEIHARVRSTRPPKPATLYPGTREPGDGPRVQLHAPEDGLAAGQACVFYADGGVRSRVLGGGWIAGTVSAHMGARDQDRQDRRQDEAEPLSSRTDVDAFLHS